MRAELERVGKFILGAVLLILACALVLVGIALNILLFLGRAARLACRRVKKSSGLNR